MRHVALTARSFLATTLVLATSTLIGVAVAAILLSGTWKPGIDVTVYGVHVPLLKDDEVVARVFSGKNAFGFACADDSVELIDEEDDLAFGAGHLFEDGL